MTDKQKFQELMFEVFEMIEDLNIEEGKYLEFAGKFKEMNINLERLSQIKKNFINNTYYIRYVRPSTKTTIKKKRLTEEQKRKDVKNYHLCSCGRYFSNKSKFLLEHYRTAVHYIGLRDIKYAKKNPDKIGFLISREVAIQSFIINHLEKVNGWKYDDEKTDEIINVPKKRILIVESDDEE